jgi:hypothetical protein
VWCVVCGVWCVVCGVWCVVCGVWCVVCGVWCVVCGVWCVVYELRPATTWLPFAFVGFPVPTALLAEIGVLAVLDEQTSTRVPPGCISIQLFFLGHLEQTHDL